MQEKSRLAIFVYGVEVNGAILTNDIFVVSLIVRTTISLYHIEICVDAYIA